MSKVAAALWLAAGFASGAPVSVSIPNADVLQGATVSVHLKATGVVLADSLIAYQVTLVYPSAMLQAVGASKASTMTQNWNDPTVGLKPDTLRVVGMTTNQPSKRWVADDANLVDLSFLVVGAASQAATVKIHEAKLFGKAGALTVDSKTNGVLTIVDNPATKTVNMDLAVGWNLVSFALAPDVSAIPDVFASASVGFVFGYVSGIGPKTWDSVRPSFLNDLKAVDALHGYWIRLKGTSAYPLSVTGAPVSVSTPMLLYKGWGLVGYLPDSRDSLSHALASLGRAYRFVSAYEALGTGTHTWDRSRPVFLNDLDILGPGLGYWMKMDSIKTLVYPTSGYKVTKAARDLAVQPRRRVLSSSKWCDFWAYQPDLFNAGDTVRVYDGDGVLCGDTLVAPEKGFLVHVTGDDPDTPDEDEGAVDGESVVFEIGGKPMNVLAVSASFDTVLVPGTPAAWEYMGSRRVLLAVPDNGAEAPRSEAPAGWQLSPAFPNPFNGRTVFSYHAGGPGRAAFRVCDLRGRTVFETERFHAAAGWHRWNWEGSDNRGIRLASGVYLVTLDADGMRLRRKAVLIQ